VSLEVTLFDADYLPGAVMLLFEGKATGTVLVTGDFRLKEKTLAKLVSVRSDIDRLYLDNTFCNEQFNFPKNDLTIRRLTTFIRRHPEHRIFIGTKNLGREKLLITVAEALEEKLCVSREKMKIFKLLGLEKSFTTDPDQSRLFLLNENIVTPNFIEEANIKRPCKGITLKVKSSAHHISKDLFNFEYSDHCSFPELLHFVEMLKPKTVLPLVKNDFTDMECFQKYLSRTNQRIPDPNSLHHIEKIKHIAIRKKKRSRVVEQNPFQKANEKINELLLLEPNDEEAIQILRQSKEIFIDILTYMHGNRL
jgi:Cft2 family RNA processing exonuclease